MGGTETSSHTHCFACLMPPQGNVWLAGLDPACIEPRDIAQCLQHCRDSPDSSSLSVLSMQIIAKGVPEDAMPGIADRQVPLSDSMVHFNNMYNSTGSKVRSKGEPSHRFGCHHQHHHQLTCALLRESPGKAEQTLA